jgi:transcriptional regulator with XRE-family HTH domain
MARRLSSNPQYSLRSFALQLGINHSTLSQLLRGKRALTPRMIKNLGERLGLRPEEIEAFIARERQAADTVVSREIRWLTMETVALLSDGSHRAILEMTSMEGFVPDTRWIARALDLTVDEVNLALSRLTRLGLLEMATANRWVDRSEVGLSNGDGFAQQVIRRLSEQARRLSASNDEEGPGGKTTSAARIEIGAAQLPALMELIDKLRRESEDLQQCEREYQLEIKIAPVG